MQKAQACTCTHTHTITCHTHKPHIDHIQAAAADTDQGFCAEIVCHLPSYFRQLLIGGSEATCETK